MFRRFRSAGAITLLVAALSSTLAGPVAAERADRYLDRRLDFQTGDVSTENGTFFLDLHLTREEQGAGFIYTPPGEEFPLFMAAQPSVSDYTLDGMVVRATIPLMRFDPNGGEPLPAGYATVAATLVRTAEATRIDEDKRLGNRWERLHGTVGPVAATGIVTLPDGLELPFGDAPGTLVVLDLFRTNPHALLQSERLSGTFAAVATDDGLALLFVELNADRDGFIEALFVPSDPSQAPLYGFVPTPAGSLLAFDGIVPVALPDESPAGDARLSLRLTRTADRGHYLTIAADWNRRIVEEVLIPSGRLSFPGGAAFDLSTAEATLITIRQTITDANSEGPSGRPAPHDAIDDALPLTPGAVEKNVWTGDTAVAAEAGAGPIELGVGHTVWYRVTGTGQQMTVDTAGSDFDTVVIVYRVEGDELVPITFGTDSIAGRTGVALNLQAWARFATEPGETYLIQVGGGSDPHDPNDVPEVGRLYVTVR